MRRFGILRISADEYNVDIAAISRSSTDPQDYDCSRARIVHSFKSGQCDGFRFATVNAESVEAALGFRSGDVVHVVNGFPMCSPELTLVAYQHWREARYLDVEFERRGAILKRRYWLH